MKAVSSRCNPRAILKLSRLTGTLFRCTTSKLALNREWHSNRITASHSCPKTWIIEICQSVWSLHPVKISSTPGPWHICRCQAPCLFLQFKNWDCQRAGTMPKRRQRQSALSSIPTKLTSLQKLLKTCAHIVEDSVARFQRPRQAKETTHSGGK